MKKKLDIEIQSAGNGMIVIIKEQSHFGVDFGNMAPNYGDRQPHHITRGTTHLPEVPGSYFVASNGFVLASANSPMFYVNGVDWIPDSFGFHNECLTNVVGTSAYPVLMTKGPNDPFENATIVINIGFGEARELVRQGLKVAVAEYNAHEF